MARDPVAESLIACEPEDRKAQYNQTHGIPIGEETLNELRTRSREYGIAFSLKPIETSNTH